MAHAIRSCDDGASWRAKQPLLPPAPVPPPPPATAYTAHAPTVAVLRSGRAAVAAYDDARATQLQRSAAPLNGTAAAAWGTAAMVVPAPAMWPNVFTDARAEGLWLAYSVGNQTHVVPVAE